jgi:Tfp pilus assembly protein PilX
VLAILLMMGLIGIASIKTSVLDMDMSRATTGKVKSFYIADGGLELAVTRCRRMRTSCIWTPYSGS